MNRIAILGAAAMPTEATLSAPKADDLFARCLAQADALVVRETLVASAPVTTEPASMAKSLARATTAEHVVVVGLLLPNDSPTSSLADPEAEPETTENEEDETPLDHDRPAVAEALPVAPSPNPPPAAPPMALPVSLSVSRGTPEPAPSGPTQSSPPPQRSSPRSDALPVPSRARRIAAAGFVAADDARVDASTRPPTAPLPVLVAMGRTSNAPVVASVPLAMQRTPSRASVPNWDTQASADVLPVATVGAVVPAAPIEAAVASLEAVGATVAPPLVAKPLVAASTGEPAPAASPLIGPRAPTTVSPSSERRDLRPGVAAHAAPPREPRTTNVASRTDVAAARPKVAVDDAPPPLGARPAAEPRALGRPAPKPELAASRAEGAVMVAPPAAESAVDEAGEPKTWASRRSSTEVRADEPATRAEVDPKAAAPTEANTAVAAPSSREAPRATVAANEPPSVTHRQAMVDSAVNRVALRGPAEGEVTTDALGTVRVSARETDGGVTIAVHASKPDATERLRAESPALVRHVDDSGVRVADLAIRGAERPQTTAAPQSEATAPRPEGAAPAETRHVEPRNHDRDGGGERGRGRAETLDDEEIARRAVRSAARARFLL